LRLSSLYAVRSIRDSIGLTTYQYEGGMGFSLVGAVIMALNME